MEHKLRVNENQRMIVIEIMGAMEKSRDLGQGDFKEVYDDDLLKTLREELSQKGDEFYSKNKTQSLE